MKFKGNVIVDCPYCGYPNTVRSDKLRHGYNFISCGGYEDDSPGCGKDFAFKVELSATVKAYRLVEPEMQPDIFSGMKAIEKLEKGLNEFRGIKNQAF